MSSIDNVMLAHNCDNNKKAYLYNNISYYKIVGMGEYYFIECKDYENITEKQKSVDLYTLHSSGLSKVKGHIKAIHNSDVLLIAAPSISSAFKMFDVKN